MGTLITLPNSVLIQETIDKYEYDPRSLSLYSRRLVLRKCNKCNSIESIQRCGVGNICAECWLNNSLDDKLDHIKYKKYRTGLNVLQSEIQLLAILFKHIKLNTEYTLQRRFITSYTKNVIRGISPYKGLYNILKKLNIPYSTINSKTNFYKIRISRLLNYRLEFLFGDLDNLHERIIKFIMQSSHYCKWVFMNELITIGNPFMRRHNTKLKTFRPKIMHTNIKAHALIPILKSINVEYTISYPPAFQKKLHKPIKLMIKSGVWTYNDKLYIRSPSFMKINNINGQGYSRWIPICDLV